MSLEWMVVGESVEAAIRRAQNITFHDVEETTKDRNNKGKKNEAKKKKIAVEEEKMAAEVTTSPRTMATPK